MRLCKRELSYKQENVSREARQRLVGKLCFCLCNQDDSNEADTPMGLLGAIKSDGGGKQGEDWQGMGVLCKAAWVATAWSVLKL